MKKALFIFFLLLPLIAFAQQPATASEETHNLGTISDSSLPPVVPPYPIIAFREEMYDFGVVSGNGPLEYTFEFRNDGTEELEIIKVSPP